MRCSAGYSALSSIWSTSSVVWRIHLATPNPCIAPHESALRIITSSVPCSSSRSDDAAAALDVIWPCTLAREEESRRRAPGARGHQSLDDHYPSIDEGSLHLLPSDVKGNVSHRPTPVAAPDT